MRFTGFLRIYSVGAVLVLTITSAWCANYKTLYSFGSKSSKPSSGLITDEAGNGYGATSAGGYNDAGTVYELSPKTGYHLVYAFRKNGSGEAGGYFPQGNLILDSAGNLYGTTIYGGITNSQFPNGAGVVFKLTPTGNGQPWTESVLYTFCSQANCSDGANPQAGVIFDSSGNLYGTTRNGGGMNCGPIGCGTVFELQPSQANWTGSVIYTFMGSGADGGNPVGSLVFDGEGNLYGTSPAFWVFRLSPSNGGWVFTVIYQFGRDGDGADPMAGLIFDSAGDLYGTTAEGGEFGLGTVFELIPNLGSWTEIILHSFAGGTDGAEPQSNLAIDSSGNLYGTTLFGGEITKACLGSGCGTVFRLSPFEGQWSESLFRFPTNGSLGAEPATPVAIDVTGRVYGTTTLGGQTGNGVAFRITP